MPHRAEDLFNPKDTSGGTCACIPDPTDLEYSLPTHVPCVDLGTVEKDPIFLSQKGTDIHTTSHRCLRDTHSLS